ncbi:hypothetical protein DUZ99_00100 [Xylanibacillus composti]|uniref:Uncharacterized protein n=1 Tax=Xylanibacillus composti TaxID=1572762 RepID=A0A8J4H0B4_9BACL|nr:hypothetical protein [Xylanibacillus composti]MDT9723416.1 hypothetical protein [Xylanibacillus composti]GIQ68548.1 hypothetical protein XYCOK13_13720 [Xylanibacillus composti]
MHWESWSLDRILILFTALAFILIGIQVTLFHYRQNFHDKSMWLPVVQSPLFALIGLILVWVYADWLLILFALLMGIGTVSGLIGFYMHMRGVGKRVEGYKLRNFMIGPPVMLPLTYAAVSALGLLAALWDWV